MFRSYNGVTQSSPNLHNTLFRASPDPHSFVVATPNLQKTLYTKMITCVDVRRIASTCPPPLAALGFERVSTSVSYIGISVIIGRTA